MGRFTNEIVVITGVTSGVGLAAAGQFITGGAKVVRAQPVVRWRKETRCEWRALMALCAAPQHRDNVQLRPAT
jgi:NAD(P)-dependent dehydrogenase (short-subunit alcohol dehydrogenase family)